MIDVTEMLNKIKLKQKSRTEISSHPRKNVFIKFRLKYHFIQIGITSKYLTNKNDSFD